MNHLNRERTLNFIFYFCGSTLPRNALLITDHMARLEIDLSLFNIDLHFCFPNHFKGKATSGSDDKVVFFGSKDFPSLDRKFQLIIIDLENTPYKKLLFKIVANLDPDGSIVILDWSRTLMTTLSKLFWHLGFPKNEPASLTENQGYDLYGLSLKLDWYFFAEPSLLKPRRLVRRGFQSDIPDEGKSAAKRILNRIGLFYFKKHHRVIIGKFDTANSEAGLLEQLFDKTQNLQHGLKSPALDKKQIRRLMISGTKILILDVLIGQSEYIIRFPLDPSSAEGIHKQAETVSFLNSKNIMLVPKAVSYVRDDPFTYYIEEKIRDGEQIESLAKQKRGILPLYDEMLRGIAGIHVQLGENLTMDDMQFEKYILPSINMILENTQTACEAAEVFHQIKTEINEKLKNKIVMRSICHGDLKIENGIFDSKGKLKGIFDWDKSDREGITITDLACLLATSIRAQYFKNSSLVDFMKEFETVPQEFIPSYTFYFETTRTSPISPRLAILFYWVDRIHKLLKYYPHHSTEQWMKENVNPVLDRIDYFFE